MGVPWMTLLRNAIEGEGAKPIILALATVDSAGSPQVRSVVCRRLGDEGSVWMASDSRSAKNAQLALHPLASAVYWAGASGQQFRISGRVGIRISEGDSERRRIWQEMSSQTRAAFFWPTPGAARAPANQFDAVGMGDLPPGNFSLLVLEPAIVDYLNVSTSPHLRQRWTRYSEWQVEEINP